VSAVGVAALYRDLVRNEFDVGMHERQVRGKVPSVKGIMRAVGDFDVLLRHAGLSIAPGSRAVTAAGLELSSGGAGRA
jgi:hypothetical protein